MTNRPPDEPIKLSWSQLRVHGECKQKSFLIRSGHRSAVNNLRGYYHGMVVDRAMVVWLADSQRSAGDMVAMVDELIESVAAKAIEDGDGVVRWKHANDRAELREFCVELLRRLEPILYERILPHPYESAKRFKVPVRIPYLDGNPTTVILHGEMDLLVQHDGWLVWDLKGTRDDSYYRKVLGQLVFYDLATLAMHGEGSRRAGLIQPMCAKPVLEFVVNDEARRQMWARIIRMAHDIWRQDHTCKTDTAGCAYCEVRHGCARYAPAAGKTMTLGMALRGAARTALEAS